MIELTSELRQLLTSSFNSLEEAFNVAYGLCPFVHKLGDTGLVRIQYLDVLLFRFEANNKWHYVPQEAGDLEGLITLLESEASKVSPRQQELKEHRDLMYGYLHPEWASNPKDTKEYHILLLRQAGEIKALETAFAAARITRALYESEKQYLNKRAEMERQTLLLNIYGRSLIAKSRRERSRTIDIVKPQEVDR